MSRAWMPLYVADYLADTGHLTTAEHGAYLLLIMHYWSNGGLPDDERKLARIARMTPDEWADAGITLKGFFDEGWRHKRIEKELIDAQAAYDRRAAAGRRGGQAKAETSSNAKAMPEQCYSNATALLKQSQSQSHIDTNVSIDKREPSALAILSECMSEQTARDLIAHRQKLRKPLTARAAKLLAKDFVAYGNPEEAAEMMIKNGWQGFHPTWVANQTRAGPPANGRGGMASLLAKSLGLKNGRESRDTDEAVHVLSLNHGTERGNVSDDGGQLSGDIIDLLAANPGRGM